MHSRFHRLAPIWLASAIAFITFPIVAWVDRPDEWITVNKDYSSQRYVDLDQIAPANVDDLKEVCEIQLNEPAWFNSGLLMVGRTLYVTTLRATYALDAATCDLRWRYVIDFKGRTANLSSRGPAYTDGIIYRGTADGRVIGLNAQTGKVVWDVQSADPNRAETFVSAPIAWNGKVFIGIAVSDSGVRGHIKALDAKTGKELWRFYTIPIGNEPGAETWRNAAQVVPAGGGFWSSFSLDPGTNEVFGPVANPYPDYTTPDTRPGDNLYTNSVIALNAATGKLNWFHQATPGDQHDWDLGTPPTLYRTRSGKDILAIAGKDGHVFGIDRESHRLIFKTAGTTIANAGPVDATLKLVCPGTLGGAQWNGTAYHPGIGVLYSGMVDWCFYYSTKDYETDPAGWSVTEPDAGYPGGWKEPEHHTLRADFSKQPTGWVTAMDGETGRVLWKYHAEAQVLAGLVPTKSGILFAGDTRGNLLALDAKTGSVLKRIDAKGALNNGLISYAVDGTQYVAAAAGGLTLNCAGVAGPLRVSVYGLRGSDTPKIVKLDRMRLPSGEALYAYVCGTCHGFTGRGNAFPTLVRQTQLTDPEVLKAFLKSVPPPMPQLYPGLLEEDEVRLIAEHMKVITGNPNSEAPGRPDAARYVAPDSKAAGPPQWQKVYSVLASPRCINCHTVTNYTRQGNDRHPHIYGVVKGVDDKGAPVGRCAACHGDTNNAVTGTPGRPDWHAAPLPMAWESAPGRLMTSPELCAQIKDPLRNGNRDLAKLLEHVTDERLVLWAWDPGARWNGEARDTPPLSHEEFVHAVKEWIEAGASCPAPTTEGSIANRAANTGEAQSGRGSSADRVRSRN
jgi:alcohol dehydrogenase (cytochrome c)